MKLYRRTILALLTFVTLVTMPAFAPAASVLESKLRLQSDLQRHIYRSLVNGAYHAIDSKSGEIRALYPHVSHPMILRLGEHYVMCADFRDTNGNEVDVDFYMIEKNNRYHVDRTEVDNHSVLQDLIKAGKARIF